MPGDQRDQLARTDDSGGGKGKSARRKKGDRSCSLCEATTEGVAIHRKGVILEANPALAEIFGYKDGEVVGMHVLAFTAPESQELMRAQLRTAYEDPFLAVGLRKDGSRIPVEVCGKAVAYGDDSATVATVRNMSGRIDISEVQQSSRNREAARQDHTHAIAILRDSINSGRSNQHGARARGVSLSMREREVLRLLAEGLTNEGVSKRLKLSKRTVDHHVSHILTKLNVRNRTQAVLAAERAGALASLVEPPDQLG